MILRYAFIHPSFMRIVLLSWLVGWTVMTGTAQPIRLRGIITDQRTGEALAGANGQLVGESTPNVGFTANRYGFYATLTKPGPCTLIVSYVGYQTQRHSLGLQRDTLLNIALSPALNQLAEVTVQAPHPRPPWATMPSPCRWSSRPRPYWGSPMR